MTQLVSSRTYLSVYLVLLTLTAATTAVAYIDLGPFNAVAAIGIAAVKAVLVALVFMHLAYSRHRTQLVAAAGVLWLIILITFTLSDVLTRGLLGSAPRW
jgi:cytochrome c oxidase subunit 4